MTRNISGMQLQVRRSSKDTLALSSMQFFLNSTSRGVDTALPLTGKRSKTSQQFRVTHAAIQKIKCSRLGLSSPGLGSRDVVKLWL